MNKTENASVKGETEDLRSQIMEILKKLTPLNVMISVVKLKELPIDNQGTLSVLTEMIIERAIDEHEQDLSGSYAQICKAMEMKKVPREGGREDEYVNFRKLLISRCQKEYEADYMEMFDKDKYAQDLAKAENEMEKSKIKATFEDIEMKSRSRRIGCIRLIGELYKMGMLTVGIIHKCVKKLLTDKDDISLECLCILLSTAGQDFETETHNRLAKGPQPGINDLSVYFKEMEKLMEDKKTGSTVKLLLEDVIELKLSSWKKIVEDGGPMAPPPGKRGGRRNDRRYYTGRRGGGGHNSADGCRQFL